MAKIYSPHGGMVHLNGNLLCAVDVETTGVRPGYNDLIQVAVVPLNADLTPLKTVMPFYMNIKPDYPENIDYKALQVTKLTLAEIMLYGIDKWRAAELFREWFEKLNLPVTANNHKRIAPLWSNGGFDKSFLVEWLGVDDYNDMFYFQERDTQAVALYMNDRFYHHAEPYPFPKVGVGYLSSTFDITNEKAHDALSDCLTTAQIYRRMMYMWVPTIPNAERAKGPEVWFGKSKPPDPIAAEQQQTELDKLIEEPREIVKPESQTYREIENFNYSHLKFRDSDVTVDAIHAVQEALDERDRILQHQK